MPADMAGDAANYGARSLAANDEETRRRPAIRAAARGSSTGTQNDDRLRRTALARASIAAAPLSVGESRCAFRLIEEKGPGQRGQRDGNAEEGAWRGPHAVSGRRDESACLRSEGAQCWRRQSASMRRDHFAFFSSRRNKGATDPLKWLTTRLMP